MNITQNFIYLLFEIFMNFVMLYSISKILSAKVSINIKKIILLIITSELIIINNIYNLITLKIITSLILSALLIKNFYNLNIKQSLKYTVIYFIVSLLIEIVLTLILNFTSITEIATLNSNTYFKILFTLIEGILILFVFSSKKIIVEIKNSAHLIFNKININNFILFILSILNVILVFVSFEIDNLNINILKIICIAFIIITIRIIIKDKYNLNILEEKNKNLKDSYRAYSETIEDYKIMEHNLKNELYSIKAKLPQIYQKDIDKLIIKNSKDCEWITRIDKIPEGLQGIIFLKKIEAEKHHIKFYINTNKTIGNTERDYIDICNIIGILLDNAIEATKTLRNKIIYINIEESNKVLNIEIINTFNNIIDLNNIGKKNYSTKDIKSGIGLNYINNIRNTRIKTNFKIINNLFIVKVSCLLKNKSC